MSHSADGFPILVGHHSEKHARRDAKRIENGMRRAVGCWETSQYWTDRAKSALRHAKYLERPDVRYRRLKKFESEKRKHDKSIAESAKYAKAWSLVLTTEAGADARRLLALKVANYDRVTLPPEPGQKWGTSLWSALEDRTIVAEDAARIAIAHHEQWAARDARWIGHLERRIAYETAMLGETGGTAKDRFDIQVGGKVLVRSWRTSFRAEWLPVLRLNRGPRGLQSVSVRAGAIPIEEVQDYREPEEGDAEKVKAATKLAPMVNHPCEGAKSMTKAEWARLHKDYKSARTVKATETVGAYRYRVAMSAAGLVPVFLTDSKRIDPPAGAASKPELARFRRDEVVDAVDEVFAREVVAPAPAFVRRPEPEPTVFDAMKASLKAGVTTVSAPQLFPTPDALAADVVRAAAIANWSRVLEPSAGTGQLVRALRAEVPSGELVMVETSDALCAGPLRALVDADAVGAHWRIELRRADFLELTVEDLGLFDAIVTNPPFAEGAGIAHVAHAVSFLRPGGRLVAILSAAVEFRMDRAHVDFRALVAEHGGTIVRLPDDSFAVSGTGVRTALVTLEKNL